MKKILWKEITFKTDEHNSDLKNSLWICQAYSSVNS